jgi:hypothetical protein
MKWFLFAIPFLLFLFLHACGNTPAVITPLEGTAVGETQTAAIWTPTITSTPDPNESKIVEWLNAELSGADALEQILDASYQVQDVLFPPASSGTSIVFRVDIRCQCAVNTQCCVPERIFVTALSAMKNRADKIVEQVPPNVSELKVVCFYNGQYIAVVAALWQDVRDYLLKQINGYQFGSRVYRSTIP